MLSRSFHRGFAASLAALLLLGFAGSAWADDEAEDRARAEAALRAEIDQLRSELRETRELTERAERAERELGSLRDREMGERDRALLERWRAERESTDAERRALRRDRLRLDRSRDAVDRALEVERRRAEARRLLAEEPLRVHADPQRVPRDFARRYGSVYPHATFAGHHLLHPRLRFGHVTHLHLTRFRHLHPRPHRLHRLPSRRGILLERDYFPHTGRHGPVRQIHPRPEGARPPEVRHHRATGTPSVGAPGHLRGGIIRSEPPTPGRLRSPGATRVEPRMVTPARPRGSIRSRE